MFFLDLTFSSSDIVRAVEVPAPTLQAWLRRGVMTGDPASGGVDNPGRKGVARKFDFCDVMEVAVAKTLIDDANMSLLPAFAAARKFAHAGNGRRLPSLPYFGDLDTLLVISKSDVDVIEADGDVLQNLFTAGPVIVLPINDLFYRVAGRLGLDSMKVLEAAENGAESYIKQVRAGAQSAQEKELVDG